MDISTSRHSSPNFAHFFDFHCLSNFAKCTNLSWMVSLWYELLYKYSIYTFKRDQWITIWWAKFELECLLLIFIYFNSKFKVTCKNRDFEYRYIRTPSKEKMFKIFNKTFAILPFSHHKTLTKLPSWVLWRLPLLMKPSRCTSQWFILTQRMQNLEFVNLKCFTYTQPIPLSLSLDFH